MVCKVLGVVCAALTGWLCCASFTAASKFCHDDVTTDHTFETLCGPPLALTNYQGHYRCPPDLKLVKPSNLEELQQVVKSHKKVRAVGTGSSWHRELFCSGTGPEAVDVLLAQFDAIRPLSDIFSTSARLNTSELGVMAESPEFPIQVDLEAMTVTVAAGVTQRQLLEYLISLGDEGGYYLGSTSAWIGQTVGGVVANGVHGSSTVSGSPSEQAIAMEVVLADGSVRWFSADKDPHLFRALRVSLGRLGVITRVTFPIHRQPVYDRESRVLSLEEHLAEVRALQDSYNAAKGDPRNLEDFMRGIDGMQMFWNPKTNLTLTAKLHRHPEGTKGVYATEYGAVSGGSAALNPATGALSAIPAFAMGAPEVAAALDANLLGYAPNATLLPAYEALFVSSRKMWHDFNLLTAVTMWEPAVPLAILGDCMDKVAAFFAGNPNGTDGFLDVMLYRFGRQESGYLSNAADGPIAWLNFDVWSESGTFPPNQLRVMEIFRDECGAKFHWGKAGWDTANSCFSGADTYPDTWCHFGCAVKELDPSNKFSGMSPIWSWQAEMAGQPVDFAQCCSRDGGFDYARCTCKSPRPDCTAASPAVQLQMGASAENGSHEEL